jgi:HPt (histidine-containing phosphotransfer) domain-containing protein
LPTGNPGLMKYRLINTEYLESVSGGDKEIVVDLITLFRDQIVEITGEMRSFYSKQDYYSLGMLAHKAKSSIAIMGMNDLATMLKTFELESKDGKNRENYESYINRYESESNEAVSELEHYITNL